MTFLWPQFLTLYILVPLYVFLYFYFEKKRKKDIIPFGNLEVLTEAIEKISKLDLLKYLPFILKTFILCLLIFAISRPVCTTSVPLRDTKIMLLMDISISMEAADINPDRITAAKEAAKQFVRDLPNGIQIGITLFSGNVRVLVNPTTDKLKTINVLNKLNRKLLEPATAIGDAILAGTESISFEDESKRKNKNDRVLVLITDGEANIGSDPLFAAAHAKVNRIIINSVGIGSPLGTIIRGGILTRLDEYTLKEVASLTGGEYFNAQDLNEMKSIYKKIRKSIRLIQQESEITYIPLAIIFVLLLFYQLLRWTKFRFA